MFLICGAVHSKPAFDWKGSTGGWPGGIACFFWKKEAWLRPVEEGEGIRREAAPIANRQSGDSAQRLRPRDYALEEMKVRWVCLWENGESGD